MTSSDWNSLSEEQRAAQERTRLVAEAEREHQLFRTRVTVEAINFLRLRLLIPHLNEVQQIVQLWNNSVNDNSSSSSVVLSENAKRRDVDMHEYVERTLQVMGSRGNDTVN